ncbi:MAG: pilin [bacterium]|nr:pilin [bacterium]
MDFEFLKGIVPCGTSYASHPCTVCDFYVLIQNIINFILFMLAPLATLAAVYIAFLFMFSGGSPAKITDAKGKLWLVVIGIFWVLGSWLVLNTIINFITVIGKSGDFPMPWSQINCEVSQPSSTSAGGASGGGGGTGGGGTGEGRFGGGGASGTFPGATLSEQEARNNLQQAGITVNKGACPSGVPYTNVSGGCTSLENVKTSTIEGAIQLKSDCNCAIQITGGTELGHASGPASHASGNKLDFRPNSTLDQYIQNNYTDIGLRSDGARQYRASNGTIYAREGDHWDATFATL